MTIEDQNARIMWEAMKAITGDRDRTYEEHCRTMKRLEQEDPERYRRMLENPFDAR